MDAIRPLVNAVRTHVSAIYDFVTRCLYKKKRQDSLDREVWKKLRENNEQVTKEIEVRNTINFYMDVYIIMSIAQPKRKCDFHTSLMWRRIIPIWYDCYTSLIVILI